MNLRITAAALLLCSAPAVSAVAERVITLSPHSAELAFSAGLGPAVVGVSERSDYPPEVLEIEKVANYQGLKLERIIALNPDLIIAWKNGTPAKEAARLEQLGFNVVYTETGRLEQIADNIELLSQYSPDPAQGRKTAEEFRSQLSDLKSKYQKRPKVSYFYQLSQKPIITMAQGSWPGEVFSLCGGENIFEHSSAPYPQVGEEQVITKAPQAIFFSRHAMADQHQWQRWPQIPAVESGHIWSLQADWINRPTVRTLKAVEQVCGYLDATRLATK